MEGSTTIKNEVLLKIAIGAASEVSGVEQVGASSIGRTIAHAFGGGKTSYSGVGLAAGQPNSGKVLFGMTISTQYGYSIPDVANEIRKAVSTRIKDLTSLDVTRVDIHVEDIREARGDGKGLALPFLRGGEEEGKEEKTELTEKKGEYTEIPQP